MNSYSGKIISINSKHDLSLVSIAVDSILFSSIVIDTPDTLHYLKIDNKVQILFKETEVIISKENIEAISIQNKIHGKIVSLTKGDLLSRVCLDSPIGHINCIITTIALKDLDIDIDDEVLAMIRSNEIMLSP